MDDLIEIGWEVLNCLKDGLFLIVEQEFGRVLDGSIGLDASASEERSEVVDYILCILNKDGAVSDEAVGSSRHPRGDRSWDRKNIASLFAGVARGNQGSGAFGRFDDDDTET